MRQHALDADSQALIWLSRMFPSFGNLASLYVLVGNMFSPKSQLLGLPSPSSLVRSRQDFPRIAEHENYLLPVGPGPVTERFE